MAERQNIIELNGQKYDARTGKIVTSSASQKSTSTKKPAAKHVDGFVRRKTPAAVTPVAKSTKQPTALAPAGKVHAKTAKSQTLMRTTVKKPVHHKIHAKVATTAKVAAPAQKPAAQAEPIVTHRDQGRLFRAKQISQSNLIRKFNVESVVSAVKTAHLPVTPAPQEGTVATTKAAKPTSTTPAPASPFDKALEIANSHFQPKVRKVRLHERVAKKLHVKPRMVTAGLVGLVVVSGASFWAYQNVPRVAMRIATTRAGVDADLPNYQPAGFSLKGPIAAAPGQVSLSYQSNSDARQFQVIQRSTNWDSQALLNNFVSSEHTQYQALQAKGRTVYLYDSNATWVDGGVWYQIAGDSKLNRDQILRIVDGL